MVDSFNSRKTLKTSNKEYDYFCIKTAADAIGLDINKLPYSLKVFLIG